MKADSDPSGYRTRRNRAEADRQFLEWIRKLVATRNIEALRGLEIVTIVAVMAAAGRGKSGPRWRLVALERALVAVLR